MLAARLLGRSASVILHRSRLLYHLVLLGLLACGGGDGTGPGPPAVPVASVEVQPGQAQLVFGDGLQLSVTLRDASGAALSGRSMSFASSNQSVVSVNSSGFATAVGKGQADISVTSEGVSGSSSLMVILVDFEPEDDTELSGLQQFIDFVIPDGVKVSATDDVDIIAEGIVTIAGTLESDCNKLGIKGFGDVLITGTVQNSCVGTPTLLGDSLKVAGDGDLELSGGKIVSSGLLQVINNLAALFPAAAEAVPTVVEGS